MSEDKAKRLTLIRHANAEQDVDVRDFERPLSRKGRGEAEEMARRFQERGLAPDLILVSAAVRTRETADTFARVIAQRVTTTRDPSLYGAVVDPKSSDFSGSVLVAYKITWQSVLFAGDGDFRSLDDEERLRPASRQFFVKLSYALQR